MIIEKGTSLEIVENDTKQTLDWKLKQLQDKNLPIESGLADYIEFGMSNIKSKIEQLTNYKDSIIEEINNLKKFELSTSENIADWITKQGIEKLKGIQCSSITINKGSEAKEESIKKVEFKTDLTQKEIEELLVSNKKGEYVEVKITKITPSRKDKIKINSKRR